MLAEGTTLAILALASLYDIKYREIPSIVMYIGLLVVVILRVTEYLWSQYLAYNYGLIVYSLVFDAILLAILYILTRTGYFGEADLMAFIMIVSSRPLIGDNTYLLTIGYMTLVYYTMIMLLFMVMNFIHNVLAGVRPSRKLPLRYRIVYLFIARPVRAKDYVKRPGWWYPLTDCKTYRLNFDLNKNPPEEAKRIAEQIRKGCLREDEYIWVSYGVPAIPVIALAYLLALLTGDKPLLVLFGLKMGVSRWHLIS
ncbi:MAG: A24 family peptidase C-terminal domain-containing protein [Pyrodictiaceae archaeon]